MEKLPYPIVAVSWVDQHYMQGPCEVHELLYEVPGLTVGFLVAEDTKQIALAAESFSHNKTVRHIIHIPKQCIVEIKRIKEK